MTTCVKRICYRREEDSGEAREGTENLNGWPAIINRPSSIFRVPLPYGHAPSMIPMRRQSIRCHFRKGIDWCSWKLIAIVVIMLSLCLTAALTYVAGNYSHIAFHAIVSLLRQQSLL